MFSYSIVSGVALALLWAIYRLILAGAKQPRFNRGVLLSIYAMSFVVIPAVVYSRNDVFNMFHTKPVARGAKPVAVISTTSDVTIQAPSEPGTLNDLSRTTSKNENSRIIRHMMPLLAQIYLIGLILSLTCWIVQILYLVILIRKGAKQSYQGHRLILLDTEKKLSPFSWMGCIVMRRCELDSDNSDTILLHEITHLRRHHSLDLVVARLCGALCWFNPATVAMTKALKDTHEFEADEAVIESGKDIYEYQTMLIKKVAGAKLQSVADNLCHSKLKKRITMMQKTKSNLLRKFGAFALVPAAVAVIALARVPAVANVLSPREESAVSGSKINEISSTAQTPDEIRMVYDRIRETQDAIEKDIPEESDVTENTVIEEYAEETAEPKTNSPQEESARKEKTEIKINAEEVPDIYIDGKFVGNNSQALSGISPDDIATMTIKKDTKPFRILIETKKANEANKKNANDGLKGKPALYIRLTGFDNLNKKTSVSFNIESKEPLSVTGVEMFNNEKKVKANSISLSTSDDVSTLVATFPFATRFKDIKFTIHTNQGDFPVHYNPVER